VLRCIVKVAPRSHNNEEKTCAYHFQKGNLVQKWVNYLYRLLENVETYGQQTKKLLQKSLKWLDKWACSRTYGLGSRIPWDPTFMIDSLSDSTVYPAFYTVAHLLQGGVIDGSQVGPAGIRPEQLTREVRPFPCPLSQKNRESIRFPMQLYTHLYLGSK
jgi:leucyl-tRNA synthetase